MALETGNGMMNDTKKYYIKEDEHKEYASKNVAGTALGLSIGALALTLLGRNNVLGNLLGNNDTCNNGCNVTCSQRLADTKEFHNEMFGLYKSQVDADFSLYKGYRDSDDAIVAKHNTDAFNLYKYSRDGFDALQNEICNLKSRVAVAEAVRPYQDALIECQIADARKDAAYNLERRTCRMISGEVVLPTTPTVTGYGSYNICRCGNTN